MLVETENLDPISIGQVGIAAHDQVVLVVATARRVTEVMTPTDDRWAIRGEVGDHHLGVHQQPASLTFQSLLHPPFEPLAEQRGCRELRRTIGMETADAAGRVLDPEAQDVIVILPEQGIEKGVRQAEGGRKKHIAPRAIDDPDELGQVLPATSG